MRSQQVTKLIRRTIAIALLLGLSPLAAPQLLAFPYATRVDQHCVYSETPIDPRVAGIVTRADQAVARSPLALSRASDQSIFLTNGGWRWSWLALRYRRAFALTRPVSEAVIVNRSDVAHDAVANGAAIAGHRTLHGILAHEMTHGLIRAHFGILADYRYPAELREGYCDYVAGGGSISDGDVLKLQRSAPSAPALVYWAGRKKVAAALAANHGNVDAMFANWRG